MAIQKSLEQLSRAPAGGQRIFGKLSGWKAACVFLFCAAMPIASSAQTFTTLVNFDGSNGGGPSYPTLVQGRDGNFYGTTSSGGDLNCSAPYGCGTVFKITRGGTLTVMHSFDGNDGSYPTAGLVQATDGNFYGTTWGGGASNNCYAGCGTIFKITPASTLTTLHSFDGIDGSYPLAGLVQATDGNFYGTTQEGGTSSNCFPYANCGTIFKITPAGTLTTLHSFDGIDGAYPYAGLVQATDGNFYGTAYGGGSYGNCPDGCGTVFKITPAGTLTTLHSFDGIDGQYPFAGLVQATDRNFYGTIAGGGAYGYGTVFKITPTGTLTTLHSFDRTDGASPLAGLVQATDGNLYGTTRGGGDHDYGTVFSLDMGLTPFVSFVRSSGRVGQIVEILGQGFAGTTGVSFNGTPATFRVLTHAFLGAIVPAGATSGYVTVTTPCGTLTSNVPFRVRK